MEPLCLTYAELSALCLLEGLTVPPPVNAIDTGEEANREAMRSLVARRLLQLDDDGQARANNALLDLVRAVADPDAEFVAWHDLTSTSVGVVRLVRRAGTVYSQEPGSIPGLLELCPVEPSDVASRINDAMGLRSVDGFDRVGGPERVVLDLEVDPETRTIRFPDEWEPFVFSRMVSSTRRDGQVESLDLAWVTIGHAIWSLDIGDRVAKATAVGGDEARTRSTDVVQLLLDGVAVKAQVGG